MGRPRSGSYAASELARARSSEGSDVSGLALQIEAMPARHDRRGGRRFGKEHFGVDSDQHGFVAVAASEDRRTIEDPQGFQTEI